MTPSLSRRLMVYQVTAIFSVLFALAGFSYNVWRMEISEQNNTTRMACFEMLTELAALEQLVYTAVYDGDLNAGSPRKGWVKVGLIADLSGLTSGAVTDAATALRETWSANWARMTDSAEATEAIVAAVDAMRSAIKRELATLE